MILHVPPDLSIGKTQEEETKQVWDTYDGVYGHLVYWGFAPNGKPPFPLPDIQPEQYVNVEGAQYPILMAQVNKWFEYTSTTLAMVRGRLIAIENEMDMINVDIRKELRRQVKGGAREKIPEAELKEIVKEHPRYRELLLHQQNYDIMRLHLEAVLENLDRHGKGLSRQITIRGQEIDLTGASNRRAGRPYP